MKNLALAILLTVICIYGCNRQCPLDNSDIVARINNYSVTKAEFEKEYLASPFAKKDTPESRKEFLDNLINRKLVLQDAEKKGLDKDPAFLGMIQRFWEQSLLKLAIDRKTKEIANSAFVSDKSVDAAYKKMAKDGKADKPLSSMAGQIKWEITKLKEAQMMANWLADMRSSAQISINYSLLGRNQQGE
jgi:hypothetical protein